MALKMILWSILSWSLLASVISTGPCKDDAVSTSECKDFVEPTCGEVIPAQHPSPCQQVSVCKCPSSSPFRWGHRCYTESECPKVTHDMPSSSRIGHNFVIPGVVCQAGLIFGMHISALKVPPHWYHSIALFKFENQSCAEDIRQAHIQDIDNLLSINYRVPTKLADLLSPGNSFLANMALGVGPTFSFIKQCQLKVADVLDLRRYAPNMPDHSQFKRFLLFGVGNNAYISHIASKCRDFQQVIWLKKKPRGVHSTQLKRGVVIELTDLPNEPVIKSDGHVEDPLTKDTYNAIILATGKSIKVSVHKKYPFDDRIINIGC